ncbi:MAG: hypothetical protein ATN34_00460 [Epulopiscium sp. Nele67-Bin002]|nr:MAG: hypothetical protein ATN34_00460 [Epulopiscium sp. Nele67-Bin002]OON94280.1 MAG: ribonuclease III [Epulopiscium sp. Nele67-Bin001]
MDAVIQMLDKTNSNKVSARDYSPLVLAYIGDGIYEVFIRDYIIKKGNAPVNKLHKAVRDFVRAQAQATVYHAIFDSLTEEEVGVLKRGRNAKSVSVPKNADVMTYRLATGVEALIGYLYLDEKLDRIAELMSIGMENIEQNNIK